MPIVIEKQNKLKELIFEMELNLKKPLPDKVNQSVSLICKKGHNFSKRFDLILAQGVKCQECVRINQRATKILNLCIENNITWSEVDIISRKQRLEFKCSQNHVFLNRYDVFCLKGERGCQICQRITDRRERNLLCAKEIAKEHNATLISEEVDSSKVRVLFKCKNGHEVNKSLEKIKHEGFCGKCSKDKNNKLRQNKFLEKIQKYAKNNAHRLISTNYINNRAHLDFECPQGHIFSCCWSNFQSGHRCPHCSGKIPEVSYLDRAKLLAKKNKGKLISSQISHANSKVEWKCKEGHLFSARLDHVRHGSWCFICNHGERHTIELMNKCAEERGGKCIKYIGPTPHGHSLFLWECSEGHRWQSASINVYNRGNWCRECSTGIGERFCRIAFEAIFDQRFPSGFHRWLRNSETGRPMELDGYNEKLKIAFEHQGVFHEKHFRRNKNSNTNTNTQIERDRIKRLICKKRGIVLIEIPEVPRKLKLENLTKFIIDELSSRGIDVLPASKPDFNRAYLFSKLQKFAEFVEAKGGKVLEYGYRGADQKHKVQCEYGHIWYPTPDSVLNRGTWCSICTGQSYLVPLKKQVISVLAEQNAILLDEKINKKKQLISIRCKEGHNWQTTVGYLLKNKNSCGICQGRAPVTTERAELLAKQNSGKCLKFIRRVNSQVYFLWECKNGHTWEAAFNNIQRGKWCPKCRKSRGK